MTDAGSDADPLLNIAQWIEVFAADTSDAEITDQIGEGRLIDEKHTRLRISWPPTS